MAQGLRHEYGEHLTVTDSLTVQGAVKAGATVGAGATLVVQGAFAGPLVVERDGVADIQGSFTGNIEHNDGIVLLYGQIHTVLHRGVGRVVVGVDSVMGGSHDGVLQPDGTLRPPRTGQNLNVRTDVVCVYDADLERFVPLPAGSVG